MGPSERSPEEGKDESEEDESGREWGKGGIRRFGKLKFFTEDEIRERGEIPDRQRRVLSEGTRYK